MVLTITLLLTRFMAIRAAEIVECVCMWTESDKICKVWALINQVLPRYFLYYGLWLNKSNHRVKQVNISESTGFNQLISMSRFYPTETLIFIREFFCFPIIHHDFQPMWEEFVIQIIEKPDICIVASWNC